MFQIDVESFEKDADCRQRPSTICCQKTSACNGVCNIADVLASDGEVLRPSLASCGVRAGWSERWFLENVLARIGRVQPRRGRGSFNLTVSSSPVKQHLIFSSILLFRYCSSRTLLVNRCTDTMFCQSYCYFRNFKIQFLDTS